MTPIEYFDLEQKLIDDAMHVDTTVARNAICKELKEILNRHKQIVCNTLKQNEVNMHEHMRFTDSLLKGQTPNSVKAEMKKFGFYELEEVPYFEAKNDIARKIVANVKALQSLKDAVDLDKVKEEEKKDTAAEAATTNVLPKKQKRSRKKSALPVKA